MKRLVLRLVIGSVIGLVMISAYFKYTNVTSVYAETRNRPVATVELSTKEQFKIELYPEEAPNTVNNFIYLVQHGFYEGTQMNRMLPGYLVQGGDPIGNGKGFPGYFIQSECKYNGVKNGLKHSRGVVSMARSSGFNTEGSQFFILLEDDGFLNGKYSAFGKIIEGLDVIENMSERPVDGRNRPVEPIWITSITIETHGIAYDAPEVLSVKEVLAQHG